MLDALVDFRPRWRHTPHSRPTGLAPRRVFTEPCHHGNAGALTTRFQPYPRCFAAEVPIDKFQVPDKVQHSSSNWNFGAWLALVIWRLELPLQSSGWRCIFCCTIPVPRDRLLRSPLGRHRQRRVSRCPDFPPRCNTGATISSRLQPAVYS